MTEERRRASTKGLAFGNLLVAAAFCMPLVVFCLVLKLGVNIPFSDERDWTPFLYHAQNGTLTLAELWRQHNEHRMFFASVIVLVLAKFNGWNLVREELMSVLLCAASQLVLWQLARRSIPDSTRPLAFLVMSLQLWNVGQAENFAMGLQVGWMLLECCILLVVWRLTTPEARSTDLFIAASAATIASYSSEIGLLAWPVGLCAMLLSRSLRRAAVALWIAWGAIVYIVFRAGFVDIAHGHIGIADHIGPLILYSVAYLGVPVAFWSGLSGCLIAGVGLLLLLLALFGVSLRNTQSQKAGIANSAAWYALALFAVLGAIGTAPSRLGLGLESVVTSTRYILVSSWLSTAVIALTAMRFRVVVDVRSLRATPAGVLMLAFLLATGLASLRGYRDWQYFSLARQADIRALQSGAMADLAPYFGSRAILMSDVAELRLLHNGPLGP